MLLWHGSQDPLLWFDTDMAAFWAESLQLTRNRRLNAAVVRTTLIRQVKS